MKPKKNRRVTIRITEAQFERFVEKLIQEKSSKSSFLRSLLMNELKKN